jgi:hypothetical protein
VKILVFCPTYKRHDGTLAIHPDTSASIDALEYGEHEVTRWISADDHEDKTGNVYRQYCRAVERVKDESFDAVLFIEHDMIVPPDCLIKMAGTDAEVVYGVYLFRHAKPTLSAFRNVGTSGLDQPLTMFSHELEQAQKAIIWPVSGLGFGCTFIHAGVFDRVTLRKPDNGNYPDGPFADDCARRGVKQVARFDILCGHIRPDGYVLWPFSQGGFSMNTVRVKILTGFNGRLGNTSVRFVEGEERTLPLDDAVDFQRAGYLSILEKTPAVKIIGKREKTEKAVK